MAKLGNSDLDVFALNLGGNVFGWTADESASEQILDQYAAAGGNFIDSADVYSAWVPGNSGGESERIIGNWMKSRGNRDQMIIATKVGMNGGLSAANINQKVEQSLKNLQTDYIDLYYSHKDDTDVPLEETLGAYNELIQTGKVRNIAASNYTADRLEEALKVSESNNLARYVALQPHYNLMDRSDFEGPLQVLCQRENIAVLPYYALASGFLSGKYRPESAENNSPRADGASEYLKRSNAAAVLTALDDISTAHGVSVAAIALAWLAAQPSIAAPIASARTTEQLRDLLEFPNVRLSSEDIQALSNAAS